MQRELTPTDPQQPILVAGDPERLHIQKCATLGGIPYPKAVIEHMVRDFFHFVTCFSINSFKFYRHFSG